ncbi:hypothetical protein [Magnetospirillum sp. UT-4]|uniref:hypothetical protein n=1 Tax=Magnetospirillum sp. UT-4 TaxID=2681467 RepID=UPI0015719C87|nr:hypothetical protein [Magnetospirillum sp. UT-4]
MLGKMIVQGLFAAALVGSAAALYAQAADTPSAPLALASAVGLDRDHDHDDDHDDD